MRYLFLALFALISGQGIAQVHELTLDNGLKVIVKEDHRAPIAVSMIWYNIGSADEPGGITGVSHVLEHLMFKGTKAYPRGVFSKTIASLGGQENAFTNTDYTAYFEKIAATNLATAFKLEADRMKNLIFDEQEFAHEMKVIQEERRLRVDDKPQALAFERFLATAHLSAPYQHPVIGWMGDLEQMTVADANRWYRDYYAPNNAILVVVGDVNPKSVFVLAKQYFGSLKPGVAVSRKRQQEPPYLGQKSVEVHTPAQLPMLILGFTTPSVKTASTSKQLDPYALELIAGLLDAGDSSRIAKHLIREQQVASMADVYYNLYQRYQTQFALFATPAQGHTMDELKKALLQEIERLKTTKVSDKELKRVKTQLIAQKTYERDSIFGQAMELGLLETIGLGWQTADSYTDRINQVTADQIQAVAKQYFNEQNLTEAKLIPESQHKGQP